MVPPVDAEGASEAGEAVGGDAIAGQEYSNDCTSFRGMFKPVTSTQDMDPASS
jgi:hypothetical protein